MMEDKEKQIKKQIGDNARKVLEIMKKDKQKKNEGDVNDKRN